MIGMGRERTGQTVLLARREAFSSGAENMSDAEKSIALAAAMTEGLLLDPAANIIHRRRAELDDMEGIEHAGGVFELVIDRVLVCLEWVQCRDLDPVPELLASLVQPVAVDRPGPGWHQV